MKRKNFPGRKERRRAEADQRQIDYEQRAMRWRIRKLDVRLGPDIGASKERSLLALRIPQVA